MAAGVPTTPGRMKPSTPTVMSMTPTSRGRSLIRRSSASSSGVKTDSASTGSGWSDGFGCSPPLGGGSETARPDSWSGDCWLSLSKVISVAGVKIPSIVSLRSGTPGVSRPGRAAVRAQVGDCHRHERREAEEERPGDTEEVGDPGRTLGHQEAPAMDPRDFVEHAEPGEIGLEQDDPGGIAIQVFDAVSVERDSHVGFPGSPGA